MIDKVRSWLRGLFPVVNGIFIVAYTAILVWDGWPIETAQQRLQFLGWGLVGFVVIHGLWYFMNKIGSISATIFGNQVDIKGGDNE